MDVMVLLSNAGAACSIYDFTSEGECTNISDNPVPLPILLSQNWEIYCLEHT